MPRRSMFSGSRKRNVPVSNRAQPALNASYLNSLQPCFGEGITLTSARQCLPHDTASVEKCVYVDSYRIMFNTRGIALQ